MTNNMKMKLVNIFANVKMWDTNDDKGKQIVPAESKGWFWNSGYIHLWEAPLPLCTSAKNSFC